MKSMGHSIAFIVATCLAVCTSFSAAHAKESERFACNETFTKPAFATVDIFENELRARNSPWKDLVTPDELGGEEVITGTGVGPNCGDVHSDAVHRIHNVGNLAIISAEYKPFRTSPFCEVVFLLVKQSDGQFHVADFIRKTEGPSYSCMGTPAILELEPRKFLHLHFSVFRGGRKWSFDTDEFYIVKNNRFQRTLALCDGCFLSPADPYEIFEQSAKIKVTNGKLSIMVDRFWTTRQGTEPKQQLTAIFRWNPHSETFTSEDTRNIELGEPEVWTGKGLPTPPAH